MALKSLLARHGPTALVMAALAATGWAGHRTGWRVPTRAAHTAGPSAGDAREDWCAAHAVPESRCMACRPELTGQDPAGWCKEHGVPESGCVVCHPEIRTGAAPADWCREHGVPESGCTLCHPGIAARGPAPAEERLAAVSVEGGGALDPSTCRSHLARIQLASGEAARRIGLELATVAERPMASYLRASGEIELDLARVAHVSPRAPGSLRLVQRSVGDAVRAGDLLALVDAAEVGRAKGEVVGALAARDAAARLLERAQGGAATGLTTETQRIEARAALHASETRLFAAMQSLSNLGLPAAVSLTAGRPLEEAFDALRRLGIPASAAAALGQERSANLLPILAPIDGIVTEQEAVAGEVVSPEKTLFVIADATRVWAVLSVRAEDAPSLAVGQTLSFRPDGGDDEDTATGAISWIATVADPKTRTVKVRAALENALGRLRIHTFGVGRVTLRSTPRAVVVPEEAVQWEGCCRVVFVRRADDVYETRKVRLGARAAGLAEVTVGVLPGEVVVTTGSRVLLSEVMKSRLGAGCADE